MIPYLFRPVRNSIGPSDSAPFCAVCLAGIPSDPYVRLTQARLYFCQTCFSWTYFPRPTVVQLATLHDTELYFAHPYFEERRKDRERLDRRCRETFARIAQGIDLTVLSGAPHLDVGCDTGGFLLSAARQFGTKPIGIDVSRRAVAVAIEHGIEAHCTDLERAPAHLVDLPLITAIDLLEHVPDPRAFLRSLASRLRPGGVAYIETPNVESSVYRLGRILCNITRGRPASIFERLFPPQHVQYITELGLKRLAAESSLEIVNLATRPIPRSDIAANSAVRLTMDALQILDEITSSRILMYVLLRRQ